MIYRAPEDWSTRPPTFGPRMAITEQVGRSLIETLKLIREIDEIVYRVRY